MAREPVSVSLRMADDRSELTLILSRENGEDLGHVNLAPENIRHLLAHMVQALHIMEGSPDEPSSEPGKETALPMPVPLPKWRLAQLDTGQPLLAFEPYPGFWTAYSMTVEDGQKLAELLWRTLGPRRQS